MKHSVLPARRCTLAGGDTESRYFGWIDFVDHFVVPVCPPQVSLRRNVSHFGI